MKQPPMKMKIRYFLQVLTFAILFSLPGYSQVPAKTLPDFEFLKPDNRSFTNKDLPKESLLFFMFFDPDCDHCQHAIKNIDEQYRSFAKTTIYLVSVDDKEKMKQFLDNFTKHLKFQKNVVLLRDAQNQFIARFKPYRYPGMFLYSADKKLVDYEDNAESVFRIVHFIDKTSS
jgi:peroxiredoxin